MKWVIGFVVGMMVLSASAQDTGTPAGDAAPAGPLPVRVVVVTMFETGETTGDQAGEMQLWAERLPADTEMPFPAGDRPLRYNEDKQVLVINTGVGTARAATSVTAIGYDPRFDVSQAYWLVAGISGGNPNTAPLASAVWADWVVDGDLSNEIDAREIPADWPTGYVPLFEATPYAEPRPTVTFGVYYHLNEGLVDWAYRQTSDVELSNPPGLETEQSRYTGYDAASLPPAVMRGDTLSASTFWHGDLLNHWAEDWVGYWTGSAGTFATSAMEDTGTLTALTALDRAGRADIDRVLVLRTTSNFTVQPDGDTAAQSLADVNRSFSAFDQAVEAAYAVGSVVVNALVDNWDTYADTIPGG